MWVRSAMETNAAGTCSVGAGVLMMLAFGLVSSAIEHRLPRRLFQAAALIVVLLGGLTPLRGLAMNGLIPHAGLW